MPNANTDHCHLRNTKYLKIQERSPEDRPREKLLSMGPSQLTTAELLAILIGSGVQNMACIDLAQQILKAYDNDISLLLRQSATDLQTFSGIGKAKAAIIISALELVRRFGGTRTEGVVKRCKNSKDAYDAITPHLMGKVIEQFWVLLLANNNTIIRKCHISTGGFAHTTVDSKVVFRHALAHAASKIILVHNHPSDSCTPSQADITITRELLIAGRFLDIEVVDHIIFTNKGYYSFADEGMLVSY